MNKLEKHILTYNKGANGAEYSASEIKRTASCLQEMHTKISLKFVNKTIYPIGKVFDKIYSGLKLKVPSSCDLRSLVRDNNVAFVVNHQSHADYMVLNYILFTKFGITPYTAGGINLNFFPIGSILRNMGCVFIRRSFHDDPIYKQTLKSYLHYLMTENQQPLEFYYEGGRSRNGSLLLPKFGFFNMLLGNYQKSLAKQLPSNGKPLLFIPVAIVHESLPEHQSMAKEVSGLKKNRESFFQLFKMFHILKNPLGTVHVHIGTPIEAPKDLPELKQTTHQIAFSCFREVATHMPITPVALCSLVLLNGPLAGISLNAFWQRAKDIMHYAKFFDLPLTEQLGHDLWEKELQKSLDFLISSNMLEASQEEPGAKKILVLNESQRIALAYYKNSILQHFFLPLLMLLLCEQIRSRRISHVGEIESYIAQKRAEVKFEIYVPTVKSLLDLSTKLLTYFADDNLLGPEDLLTIPPHILQELAEPLRPFGNFFLHKYEAYYTGSLTLLNLGKAQFTQEEFLHHTAKTFNSEKLKGPIVSHSESYSLPAIKNTLHSALQRGCITSEAGRYTVSSEAQISKMVSSYAQNIDDIRAANSAEAGHQIIHPQRDYQLEAPVSYSP